jgi:hypothetical protein
VWCTGAGGKCLNSFGCKPYRTIPLGRPRGRWEDNIKVDVAEIALEGMDWVHLARGSCSLYSVS